MKRKNPVFDLTMCTYHKVLQAQNGAYFIPFWYNCKIYFTLFDKWLLQLGNGELPHGPDDIIQLPSNMCIQINSDTVVESQYKLIEWV